jgi:hypothetical protein
VCRPIRGLGVILGRLDIPGADATKRGTAAPSELEELSSPPSAVRPQYERKPLLGDVTLDELGEAEEFPEPESQPAVTKSASVGPADRTHPDAYDIGIIWNRELILIGEEAELLRIDLSFVDDDRAVPTMLLVVVQFAEIGDDVLPRPGLGSRALHQCVVGVGLAVLVASVSA